jgi:urease accessory protein
MVLPVALKLIESALPLYDARCALTYDERLLRRRRLTAECGLAFLVDLPKTTSLDRYAGLELEDGRRVEIIAADEDLLAITGPDMLRYAWHIGNRHTPCQIGENRLVIQNDHVLADMLRGLGAVIAPLRAPFTPEGGAYGHGRTMPHSHSHD